jgi:ABC-type branched-subunit amino acid transport system substrate-binding protein
LRGNHPDVVFAYVLSKSGLFFRKLSEAGLKQTVVTNYWIQSPEQMEAAGNEALEQVVFEEVNSEKPLFRQAYRQAFPNEPYNPAAYLCYASMGTILQASKRGGAFRSADRLGRALTQVEKVNLLDGELTYINREAQFDLAAKTFKAGKIKPLP